MKLTNIKNIFFDLDHTLWDFDKNSGLAFHSIFQKNRIGIELEKFLQVYTPINENYWKLYQENKISQDHLRYGRLRDSFDLLKIVLSEEQIQLLSKDYIDHLPNHNHLLEGAVELLEYLEPNYRLHIITNGFEEVQLKKMRNSEITHFFDSITTSEDAGVKKPNKLIFEVAMRKAGASISNSVMIGDNFEVDILGAQQIGMRAILYNYHKREFSNDCLQVLEMREIHSYF